MGLFDFLKGKKKERITDRIDVEEFNSIISRFVELINEARKNVLVSDELVGKLEIKSLNIEDIYSQINDLYNKGELDYLIENSMTWEFIENVDALGYKILDMSRKMGNISTQFYLNLQLVYFIDELEPIIIKKIKEYIPHPSNQEYFLNDLGQFVANLIIEYYKKMVYLILNNKTKF